MIHPDTARAFYKKLLTFYPKTFKELFAESMEQTFHDLCNEKRQTKKELFSFILWMFIETAMGIFKEHLLLISLGDIMQTILKSLGLSAFLSFLLILPFVSMEIVNRRNYNEDFPFALFFALWLSLFAIIIILLPILQAWWAGSHDMESSVPAQRDTLLTNPRLTLLISILLFLAPGIFPLLNSIGWVNVDRLFNGPNPEVAYIPGLILSVGLIAFPIMSGIIAGWPITSTLRTGGRLFAYPIHLIIVVMISFFFASGVVTLIIDQWPCFIGVPVCD
jgi:hypothetical protein